MHVRFVSGISPARHILPQPYTARVVEAKGLNDVQVTSNCRVKGLRCNRIKSSAREIDNK